MRIKKNTIKKSLLYSIIDGSCWASMYGLGESYISAFGVFLKATPLQLGILGSFPQLIGAFSQLYSNTIIKKFISRKKIVISGVLMQALTFIPIALVFFAGQFKVYYLILFFSFYYIFAMVITPVWYSWMGDLIPPKKRGTYFGLRNNISGFITFTAFTIGGIILQKFSVQPQTEYLGFMVIFLLAFFSRACCTFFLAQQYEPKLNVKNILSIPIQKLFQKKEHHQMTILIGFLCLMNFSVCFVGPFIAPYLLKELHFSYAQFMMITSVALFMRFLAMPLWGRLADHYGSLKIMAIVGILLPFNALLFVFGKSFWYLMSMQAYNGFAWAGFEILAIKYMYDKTNEYNRTQMIAYYGIFNGICGFSGALISGFLLEQNWLIISNYNLIFLISFVLRLLCTLIFIPQLRTNPIKKINV